VILQGKAVIKNLFIYINAPNKRRLSDESTTTKQYCLAIATTTGTA